MNTKLSWLELTKLYLNNPNNKNSNLLFNRLSKYLYLTAGKWTTDSDIKDDIVSETMETVFRTINKYDFSKYGVNTIAAKILYNNFLQHIQSKSSKFETRFKTFDSDNYSEGEFEMANSSYVDVEYINVDEVQQSYIEYIDKMIVDTKEYISKLDYTKKKIFELTFYQNYKNEETAKELGIPVSKVKNTIFHTRRKMMKDLEYIGTNINIM